MRASGLGLVLGLECVIVHRFGPLADRRRQGGRVLGVLGRAGANGVEIDAVGCTLGERETCERESQSQRDEEKFPIHSAQQFRLRQTR